MKHKELFQLNLQLFADGQEGDEGGTGTGQSTPPEFNPDELTDEQVAIIKDKFGLKDDTDVDSIINTRYSRWQKELDEKQNEAAKLAAMDEKQKADYEMQQLQDKIAAYERKEQLAEMSETASGMLNDKGIQPTKEVLEMIVSEDADKTSNNVKSYIAAIEAERESIKADFEKRLGGKIPLDGSGTATLSRGAQLAKAANNQTKKPDNDPWALK
ncbi:DUF4355 domain-containing protein [Lactococcus taiwanensis]|uniref:DUF4355 domain-containing protein n=1 Tax=Lactococcus taiwanensis TaxID=1151742 RepID=A0AA45KGX1_9LACT|nr:DUF4355 domain-containing protein [Lactococcus taiwanensis]QSE76323.1 DUF4355 domain-containing protein [Lactococcus taiwanensis]